MQQIFLMQTDVFSERCEDNCYHEITWPEVSKPLHLFSIALLSFLNLTIGCSIDHHSTFHELYKQYYFYIPKTVTIIFLPDIVCHGFSGLFGESKWPHTIDCCFALVFIYDTQDSLPVTILLINISPSALYYDRKSKAELICCVLWFLETTFGVPSEHRTSSRLIFLWCPIKQSEFCRNC